MPGKILVVDDEQSMCDFMEIMLTREGYKVDKADCGKKALELSGFNSYDLIIADLMMPEMTGLELLAKVRKDNKTIDFIVMTAFASVDTAIEAMKQGAIDYITKPFKVDEIKLVIEKSLTGKKLKKENKQLKKQLVEDSSFENFIGQSEEIIKLKRLAGRVAGTDSTVLIRGESGTGKDLVAKAIHAASDRARGPFVTINCAALPENLLESELFGYKKGAFTGAVKDKEGLFKVADGGTFFLDEVGNTSLAIQVKLLRVLEDKVITPVGDTKPIKVDIRLIAATNADLEAAAKTESFRSDLFYRLNVIPIHIPPLRKRVDDITLLINHFTNKYCSRMNSEPKEIMPDVIEALLKYNWPGNVRELENCIERAILLSRSKAIKLADFPTKITDYTGKPIVSDETPETPTLESIEKAYIYFVMNQSKGKKAKAAKTLGIDNSTLYRKLERYKLQDTDSVVSE
ncbi:MAG: sigma-54-dependent Fis family transcriptional regulator [candidate division Zixibacteria bacterium]|nr:sigma-54-dependent Fis family transcriptional regulator [candidate division Zixibacteria bacterium]